MPVFGGLGDLPGGGTIAIGRRVLSTTKSGLPAPWPMPLDFQLEPLLSDDVSAA